jgi:uncharacterized membrane protein
VAQEERSHTRVNVPKWLPITGMVLSLAGIVDSVYLTIAHYTAKVVLACPDTGLINCAKVTTSSYSIIFGVPLVLLGLFFFLVMIVLQSPWAWTRASKLIRYARLAFCGTGILMVMWLVYVEFFKLDNICLFCTYVHILTLALFVLTAIGTAVTVPLSPQDSSD